MATLSPYRSLPAEQRLLLVTRALASSREARALYTQRLTTRGGFRAVTLNSWPVDRLANEIVRRKLEQPQDELDLLQLLYLEIDPSFQITFLDAAGVSHEKGVMPEQIEPPFADEATVRKAVDAVVEKHGEDGKRYVRTLIRYNPAAWPGIESITV